MDTPHTRREPLLDRMTGFFDTRDVNGARSVSPAGLTVLGCGYFIGGVTFVYSLIRLWPAVDSAASSSAAGAAGSAGKTVGTVVAAANAAAMTHHVALFWGLYSTDLDKSNGLLVLALLMGAIGGYTSALSSLIEKSSDAKLLAREGWFYALRPMSGAVLGLLLYFAFRAGFANSSSDAGAAATVDPYGVAVVAGLGGLFASQALSRLEGVFGSVVGETAKPHASTPQNDGESVVQQDS